MRQAAARLVGTRASRGRKIRIEAPDFNKFLTG